MECLPHHILIEIFKNLDTTSLVAASKVCQLWSELIKSSPQIMNLFNIKITSNRSRQTVTIVDELPCSRHRNIHIVDFCGDIVILKQILSMHRMTIANVKIVRPTLWHAQLFTETFSALRNLQQLILENCQLRECDEIKTAENGESESFDKLRELQIVNCNCEIFNVFMSARNLSYLHVEYSQTFNERRNDTMKYLTNLLKISSNLKKLTLLGVTKFRENPFSDYFKFPFQLKKLKIDSFDGENVCICGVKKFLAFQKNSLKFLTCLNGKICDEIADFSKNDINL